MNPWLFFRRWLANPREVGSVAPSSPALKRRLTQEIVRAPDEYVIELGGGTGAITRGILERGVPADRLYVLEINREMAQHLRDIFPGIHVIEGDARRLAEILPPEVVGKVGTTVCGIPMLLLTLEEQKAILDFGLFGDAEGTAGRALHLCPVLAAAARQAGADRPPCRLRPGQHSASLGLGLSPARCRLTPRSASAAPPDRAY